MYNRILPLGPQWIQTLVVVADRHQAMESIVQYLLEVVVLVAHLVTVVVEDQIVQAMKGLQNLAPRQVAVDPLATPRSQKHQAMWYGIILELEVAYELLFLPYVFFFF